MAGAQILCTKCGTASAVPSLLCAKCGGRNARVCGACGTQNSVAKNFCDKCGQSLSQLGAVAPPPAARPLDVPPSDIPKTAVFRLPTPGEAMGLPPAGQALPPAALPPAARPSGPPPASDEPPPLDDLWNPAKAPPTAAPAPTPGGSSLRSALNAAAALLGIALAGFGIWRWQVSQRPDVVVPRLAAEYLEALRTQDYGRAYAMFSAQARQSCTLEEFRAIRDTTAWTWSDLRIVHEEPGAILLEYEYVLQTPGAAKRTDHVLFTQEGDSWTRPYNWVLMRKVEEAFERGDADRGLLLAQSAATINPRDPMAWGYLCEAAYYRKSPADAEVRCVRALDLAQIYPSNLTLKSVYHLHAILADTYNHALNQPTKALDEFSEMLAFPNISPEDQCQILLARAQTYRQLSRPGEALNDVNRGAELCVNPQDLAFIRNMRDVLRAPAP